MNLLRGSHRLPQLGGGFITHVLRKIYHLWETGSIDGVYTLATLDRFGEDLAEAARLRSLL